MTAGCSTRSKTSLADARLWPAIVIRSGGPSATPAPPELEDLLSVLLDEFQPIAVQDLRELPLPPGGLWDPSCPPPPEPPPAPLVWRVFFDDSVARDSAVAAVRAAHADLDVSPEDVSDEDWAARSQQALTAVTAGAFIVAPPWDLPKRPPAGTSVIVIEPSRGFGTGHHASTRLCLRALSEVDVQGARVVDVGTGSGVLAMAAVTRGARQVLAVDIDPDAIDSARESALLNPRIATIHWLVGDFRDRGWDALTGGPFDVVLANLTGGMLIQSAARIRELLKNNGVLVCSGFDENERPQVETALRLTPQAAFVEESWVGLLLRA